MRKPDSLKSLLLATVPGLKDSPERLALFVDRGGIVGGGGRSLSFEYRYAVNLVVEGFADDPDALMVPVIAWIAEYQPDLINKPGAEPFTFEAEILDDDTRDISITIQLTEPVVVVPREGGGYGVTHPMPPKRHDIDRFSGVPCGVNLWQLFLAETLIAQTTDPAFEP